MKKALIFGGRSFIGRHLCSTFSAEGIEVITTSRRIVTEANCRTCDLTIPRMVFDLLERERPDWIIQCTGATHTVETSELYGLHVNGTRNVLAGVAQICPESVVLLLGSAAEYGEVSSKRFPIGEDEEKEPVTAWGSSKLAQTRLAELAAVQWGLKVITVRPFNVLGPGLPEHYYVGSLVKQIWNLSQTKTENDVGVTNLTSTRDWIDVRDVANALYRLLLTAPPQPGEMVTYNVSTGIETPLSVIAAKLSQLAGGVRLRDGGAQDSRGGVKRSCGDASRLQQATGWAPEYTLAQSLTDLWQSVCNEN